MTQIPKSLADRGKERIDVRVELQQLESSISELKVQFEQYFAGLLPLPPDKLNDQVKRHLRKLFSAPFKSSEMNFKLRGLESRYRTYQMYWERTLKQREEGSYSKDVFKANMRERHQHEDRQAETVGGKAEKGIKDLFSSYKSALEKETGISQNIDYKAFQRSVIERAKELKAKHAGKKLSFKVVVKDGKVSLEARIKKQAQ